jgi:hypothetical protein
VIVVDILEMVDAFFDIALFAQIDRFVFQWLDESEFLVVRGCIRA